MIDYKIQKKISTLAIESNSFISITSNEEETEVISKVEYDVMKEKLESEIAFLKSKVKDLAEKFDNVNCEDDEQIYK